MFFRLTYIDTDGNEQHFDVRDVRRPFIIGRKPECDISIANSKVSKAHALIMLESNGKLFVSDPPTGHPTNGIIVDGITLRPFEGIELLNGSELICGPITFKISSDGPSVSDLGMGQAQQAAASSPAAAQAQQAAQPASAQYGAQASAAYGAQGNRRVQQSRMTAQGRGYQPQAAASSVSAAQEPVARENVDDGRGQNQEQIAFSWDDADPWAK